MRLDFGTEPTATQTMVAHVVAERPVDPDVSCDINFFRRTNAATVYEPEQEYEATESYIPEPEFDPDSAAIEVEHPVETATSEPEPPSDIDFEPLGFVEPESINEPETTAATTPEQVSLDEARWGFAPESDSDLIETGNIIVFPTQPTYQAPVERYELGEPVLTRPRILDVPEEVLPTIQGPLFTNIQLDLDDELPHSDRNIDVPLQVAMVNQRVFGGIVDACVVLAGFGAFLAIFFQLVSNVTLGKTAVLAAVAVPSIFWMIYQFMFLTYAGRTLGMILAHLSLVNFEGGRPNRRRRRQRAISMIVSLISGGVGFGWAFLDPDTLCWHDSISRTYLTQER